MKSPSYAFHLIKADEDDNKFVDCAIVANAKYIVSNDRHFDVLREIPFPKVDVIKINQFLLDLQNAAETMWKPLVWFSNCCFYSQKTKKGPYPCGIQSFQNAFKQMRAITYADRGPWWLHDNE